MITLGSCPWVPRTFLCVCSTLALLVSFSASNLDLQTIQGSFSLLCSLGRNPGFCPVFAPCFLHAGWSRSSRHMLSAAARLTFAHQPTFAAGFRLVFSLVVATYASTPNVSLLISCSPNVMIAIISICASPPSLSLLCSPGGMVGCAVAG